MASLRDVRQKIKGVATTQQITGAMKMMSTARLSKAMEVINLTRAYVSRLEKMVQNIKLELPNYEHPCLVARELKSVCFVVVGGERGLCGGFNHELHRFAIRTMQQHPAKNKKIIVVGRKVARFFEQKEIQLHASFPDLNVKILDNELFPLGNMLFNLYKNNEVDEVNIIYTSFVSAVKKNLVSLKLLPLAASILTPHQASQKVQKFEYDPSPEIIFDHLIPRYMRTLLHRAIVESSAAEQSARMTAMTSATDRAEEIIDDLKLALNRSRQALITREISEVIAGSQD